MTNPNSRDPFAEVEATYVGPVVDNDDSETEADPYADAYSFDDDDEDQAEFADDEPGDWAPPTPPSPSGRREFTAPSADSPRAGVTSGAQAAEAPAPVVPRRHAADSPAASKPKRGFSGWLRSLFERGSDSVGPGEEIKALQRPLNGTINITIVNRKGGVGKTLATVLAGQTLATYRGDRVIALDASPEGGELGDRVEREQYGSVRSLLNQLDSVSRYSHVRTHTSQDESGLEVLGSDPDAIGEPILTGDEYRSMMKVLRSYYSVILTDCAQGLGGSLMEAVLEEADVLVLVSEGADGMRSAYWVASQLSDPEGPFGGKFAHLVDDLIVVVNSRSPRTNIDNDLVTEHFQEVAKSVIRLNYDQEIEGGRSFTLDETSPETRQSGLDLAKAITTSAGFLGGGR